MILLWEVPWNEIGWIVLSAFALATAVTLFDLSRHPRHLILGQRRRPWALVIVILFGLGWATWFLFGRLTAEDE